MKSKVKSIEAYDERTAANDCFWLLKQVKAVTLQFDQKRNGFLSIMDTRTSFLHMQTRTKPKCRRVLRGHQGVRPTRLSTMVAQWPSPTVLVPEKDSNGRTVLSNDKRKVITRDKTLAAALLPRC
jgi:hypothetical protein